MGRKLSLETIEKIRKACTGHHRGLGRVLTAEHREAIRKGKLGIRHTEETLKKLQKLADLRRNVPLPHEVVARMRAQKSQMMTCPHCGKTGKAGGMKRHHLDRCKFKPQMEFKQEITQEMSVGAA